MEIIAREIYGAGGIEFLPSAKETLERFKRQVACCCFFFGKFSSYKHQDYLF